VTMVLTIIEQQRSSVPNNVSKLQVLSRNALYAPVEAYSSPCGIEKGLPLSRNLEKKLLEKKLFSFLEEVSVSYHSPTLALGVDGGNHGARKKEFTHFQKNLAQRALTLMGGGVGNSLAQSTTSLLDKNRNAPQPRNSRGKRKRRKLCTHLVHGALSNRKRMRRCFSASGNGEEPVSSMKSSHQSHTEDKPDTLARVSSPKRDRILSKDNNAATDTLFGLNKMWNTYIRLLLRDHIPLESKNFKPSEIASLLSSAELVGAFVNIRHCVSHASYCGMSGFIVDISANTWRVAVLPKNVAWEFGEDCMEDLKSKCGNKCWKVVTIPKRRSTLVLSFPCCSTNDIPSSVEEYCCITISGDL